MSQTDHRRDGTVSSSGRRLPLKGAVVAAALTLVTACTAGSPAPESSSAGASGRTQAAAFDAATRDDEAFNSLFRHRFADVDDLRMHYVTGGSGPPLVLLHGWPQSWFEWLDIMPALAKRYTIYALDLPGLGDSQGAPTSYDKATLAEYVHGLLSDELGLDGIRLVAHDIGGGVGFQYAAQYPKNVARYALLDYAPPGPGLSAAQLRTVGGWHVAFHSQETVPETLVDDDDVRPYLDLFYGHLASGGVGLGGPGAESPFSQAQLDEFARTYRRPQVLTGGFELYRTLDQDERDNTAAGPIAVPTMLMTAEGLLAPLQAALTPLVSNLERAVEVPGAGHWLTQENPDFVTTELLDFLAG